SGGWLASWLIVSLDGNRGQALREDVHGAHRRGRLLYRRRALLNLGDHQHFFEPIESGSRLDANAQEKIVAGGNVGDDADRHTLGEDAIAAAGQNALAGFNLLVAHDVLHHGLAARRALDDSLQPRFLQDDARSAGAVVDHEHQCRRGIDTNHLADHAVGGDDRHVLANAIFRALIDVNAAGKFAAGSADDLRRQRLGDVLLFEAQQSLEAAGLAGILGQANLLEPQPLNFLAQLAVLAPHTAKVQVVVPHPRSPAAAADGGLLDRSNDPNRPQANEAGGAVVRRSLDLHGQPDHLKKQNGYQEDEIAVPIDDIFHEKSFKFRASSFQFRKLAYLTTAKSPAAETGNSKPKTDSYSSEILRSSLKSLSILPVPSTTLHRGSSAMETGRPVSSRIRLSKFLSSAPPPVSTMPRSLMSALNSGGVRSRATRMAFMMVETHSLSASRISLSSTVMVLGTPSIRLRPLISMVSGLSSG